MGVYGGFKYGADKYGNDATTIDDLGGRYMYMLDQIGLEIAGVATKSDITSAIPRISIGTDQRKHTDFSERDTFGQNSFHHGYGQRDLLDPLAFADSFDLFTWWSTQVTLAPRSYQGQKLGSVLNDSGYVTDALAYSGNLYFLWYGNTAATNALYLFNNTTSLFEEVTTAGIDVVNGDPLDLHIWEKDSSTTPLMLVAQGEAVNALYFNGTVWADLGVPANYFATFDNKCWRADNLNELYASTDATNTGAWGTAIKVGDASYPIRGMLAGFKGALWVGKDDGLYAVRYDTTATAYIVTKEIDLGTVIDSNNGEAMMEHQGFLYMSVRNGLLKYDGLTVQYVGPDQAQSPNGDGSIGGSVYGSGLGKIVKLTHDNNFIYAAVNDPITAENPTSTSYVMVYGGTGWHKAYKESEEIRSVFYVSAMTSTGVLANPTLWYSHGTGSINYVKLPRFGVDPTGDSSLEYQDSGSLYTSWYDASLVDIDKVFFDLVTRVINLEDDPDNGNRVEVYFQLDDWDEFYYLGVVVHSPEQTLFFPDNGKLDPNVFAKKIRFAFVLKRNTSTTTTTPIMLSYATRFVVRPQVRYGWNLTAKVYENMSNFARARESLTAQEFREFLYSRRDKQIPVHLDDYSSPENLTNLVKNPSFELYSDGGTLADGFVATGNVTTVATAQYKTHGVLGQKVICNLTNDTAGLQFYLMDEPGDDGFMSCMAGVPLFIAIDCFVKEGDPVVLELISENDLGAVVASYTFNPRLADASGELGSRTRFERGTIYYVPASTGRYGVRIVRKSATASAVTTFYVDSAEVIHDTSLTRENEFYIDGDQLRCRWNGEPHASTSTRQQGYFVYITGLTEVMRYIEDRKNTILPNSEMTIQLREML